MTFKVCTRQLPLFGKWRQRKIRKISYCSKKLESLLPISFYSVILSFSAIQFSGTTCSIDIYSSVSVEAVQGQLYITQQNMVFYSEAFEHLTKVISFLFI
jgi:hypothetical protein